MAATIAAGVSKVSIDTWLQVIPQLIARIQIQDGGLRKSIHDLLVRTSLHNSAPFLRCACALACSFTLTLRLKLVMNVFVVVVVVVISVVVVVVVMAHNKR